MKTNIDQTTDQIYQLIASVRSNGSYPAESFIPDLLTQLEADVIEKATKEAYSWMASRIDSHGFMGWMTGKYELKKSLTHNERKQ